MIEELTTIGFVKNCTYIAAGVFGVVTFIGLDPKAISILAAFMALDVFTGVIKAIIVHGKRSFKTLRLTAGVLAKLVTILIPFIVALTGHAIGVELIALASGAVTILVVSEAWSILGNIHSITQKEEKPEFDAVGAILGFFKGALEKYFESIKRINK